jgi:hypothetical protein
LVGETEVLGENLPQCHFEPFFSPVVEVGISREETGNNAGPIRESQTGSGSESETGVGYGIRESGQTG